GPGVESATHPRGQRAEVRLRDEGVGPEPIPDLLLGDRRGPAADQKVQQGVCLGLEGPELAVLRELTGRTVQDELAEAHAHGRPKAGKSPENPRDHGILASYLL